MAVSSLSIVIFLAIAVIATEPALAATIMKHMIGAPASANANAGSAATAISGPLTPHGISDGIDARQAGPPTALTDNVSEVQSSYSQQQQSAAAAQNKSAVVEDLALLLPESDAFQNSTNNNNNKTARVGESRMSPIDQHVNKFLGALPPSALEAPLAPHDVGKILFTMYNLQKAIKQARLGTSIMTPLLISQLVPPLSGPATAAYLAGTASHALAKRPTGSAEAAAALARQLNVNLNMKEMMPLLAQFLDTSVKEKCSGNSTAAAEANSDTTALLSMMTQIIQKQEQQQQQQAVAEKDKEKEKKKNPGFMSQEFINEFFTGGNNGVNIQRMMMEIATKVLADVAAKAITGG